MYRGHTTAVVVPAYNEEPFVADTVASVPEFVDRVYVVEDGSTDDTWAEIVSAAAAENARHDGDRFEQRVVPIQHERNRGVGGAIKTGYLRARDDRIDLTAVMGGDGQMEPEMLGELFDPIVDGDADYTKGNRFLGRTGRGDMPAFRFVGNATLAALTKVASGYWESGDPQSGYTAISLRALETADVESMYEFYGYCNDILVKLNVAGMRVVDVPRPITYGDEESHIKYRTYVPRVSAMLARNFVWRLKTNYLAFDFHPLVAAYAAGGAASLTAVLAAVWALPGVGSFGTPLARGAVAAAFALLGVLALVFAMVLDRADNAHLNDTVHPAGDPTGGGPERGERELAALTDGRGHAGGDRTVAVELDPQEWAYVLDGGGGDPPSPVAERVRERVRQARRSDAAAD
ncbi:glycosyltransferase family 2 protein [Halobacterium yunchengense]|uniref:glycosyltransferase family 2 protein n=1 Tax=Halobacterium yunchengense TaxID=3108497 RepID=UPI00300B6C44